MFGQFTVNRKSLLMACGNRLSAVSQRKQPVCEAERIVLPVVHVWDQLAGDPALVRSHDETETANAASKPLADFPHTIRQAVAENGQGRNEITVLIVDDHEVVREGLRLSLSRAPHIRVVGEASDGATAVALAERRKPEVVIMDVRMPGMDGLEATKILAEKVPETAVLIFTAYSERSLLGRGLESGAKGYILKEAPHETLLKAIDKVVAGEGFVDPALMPAFLGDTRDEMLTGREREILQLLADGMSNADVAQRLFISQETVKSHVRHILTKLEADTRTHAVAIALRDAIID
jgi:DNA-binding NarL/FixJ family response regulator